MAVGDKIYLADKQTLDEAKSNTETIKASLASTNSKLDLMDTKVSTKAEQSTVNTIDANVKTANTNINTINTKVGVNNDAAGTTTVFARLKQIYDYLAGTILTAINGRQANWGATSTHAERIDVNISTRASQTTMNTVNANLGSNSDGASASGSVHAKLKDIKGLISNRLDSTKKKVMIPSNTIREQFNSVRSPTTTGQYILAGKFIPPQSGELKITAELMHDYTHPTVRPSLHINISNTNNSYTGFRLSSEPNFSHPIGTVYPSISSATMKFDVIQPENPVEGNKWITVEGAIYVDVIKPIYIFIVRSSSSHIPSCRNIKIYYDVIDA